VFAVCCSVLRRVLQCVAACCSALRYVAVAERCGLARCHSRGSSVVQCFVQCVAVYCSVLQCVAVRCSTLQSRNVAP